VDSIKQVEVAAPVTGATEIEDSYSFRFPNFEVRRSRYADCSDCFKVVLSLPSIDALKIQGESLRQAFLDRDGRQVSSIFSLIFSAISYYQRFLARRRQRLRLPAHGGSLIKL
jgi:recombinational DNA repair ATPase RecF